VEKRGGVGVFCIFQSQIFCKILSLNSINAFPECFQSDRLLIPNNLPHMFGMKSRNTFAEAKANQDIWPHIPFEPS